MPHLTHNLLPFPGRPQLPLWKRSIDIAGSVLALPLLVPLVVTMTIVTRLFARGPVLFRQERVGFNGERFTMFKFRTMTAGASTDAHQKHALAFIRENRPMVKMDTRGDARLIPLGRLLRATGLDELPQVLNVLRGEMSLVGPRPCIPYEYEAYLPWQKERFGAMPGLTGLWQVSGKNRLTFEEMIRLDIHYAHTLSLRSDLRIMLLTVPTLLGQVAESRRTARRARAAATGSAALPTLSPARARVIERESRRKYIEFRFSPEPSPRKDVSRERHA